MSTPIIPGAEPVSIPDGPHGGVLLLHGYMGTVQTVRDWAMAFARAGFAVEAPLLPGHGTSAEELANTQWSDYVRCAEDSYRKLVERHQHVFVGGLCMGGPIAAWLATQHQEMAGLMIINGHFNTPKHWNINFLKELLKTNRKFFPWFRGETLQNPHAPKMIVYEQSPIAPMLSLHPSLRELRQHLDDIHCPVLVFTSLHDKVLAPDDNEPWFKPISGPVEHILLERSGHVATLDYDKDIIEARSVAFALAITESEQHQSSKEVA